MKEIVNHAGDFAGLAQLRPLIIEYRPQSEIERHLPGPVHEALKDADVLRMSTPRFAGGLELDEYKAVEVIEELSRQDGSVGWNAMVYSNTATIASYLSDRALHEIYASGPSTAIAGALLPKGQARSVDGGYLLTGLWKMASGCHHAEWMVACSMVYEEGKPRKRKDGRPDMRSFFIPAHQCQILDTWNTAGLRGTGSHDWQVNEVFVPAHLTFPILMEGPREPGALYVKDFANYAVARVAAVCLGIARNAIETFVELAKEKVATVATSALAQQHTIQLELGRAEALLRSGRAFLYEAIATLPYTPRWSEPLTDELRSTIRLAGTCAAQNATQATDAMFQCAGTSGVYSESALQLCFRDIHVANQHINVAPSNIEMVGQHLMGLGLEFRR